ncbi:MAG: V-type ATP synthase subunit D [Dehalococcoidales bacterium]|nr:V-type ATP synthase subunit D [Dehalococcoidales bacterium]
MAQQLIKVRPTKIELIKLRRRLTLATRIQKIVKDRLSILVLEFLHVAKEIVEARRRMLAEFTGAYQALAISAGYHGNIALEKEMVTTERDLEIITGSRNIAGTRVPSFELKESKRTTRGYSLIDTSSWVDRAAQQSEKCIEAIIELAELQSSLELLGREINRTKRIVNALEYLIIPSLHVTIKFLRMKFEERDREEKSRLKRVKVILGQKQ